MEVAHSNNSSDLIETDGFNPDANNSIDTVDRAAPSGLETSGIPFGGGIDAPGIPLGDAGGSHLVIDNQVIKLRHKKTEPEPAVIPPLRDSIPSQDLGDPNKFRPTGFSSMRNGRRRMEDRHVILHDLLAHLPENLQHKINPEEHVSFYAVYDGHSGVKAAASSAINLHNKLIESASFPSSIHDAIQQAVDNTDEIICKELAQGNSGTTVVLVFIQDKTLHCAWVGDSEAVLGRGGESIRLVDSHRPDRPDEKERIEELGGYVNYWGTWRVMGTMAVSRAIGDESLKPYISTKCDVTTVQLLPTDDFLIIACDGLWDHLSREEATQMVYSAISQQNFDPTRLNDLTEQLNRSSQEKGSSDNISTILVFLRPIQDIIKDMEFYGVLENRLEGITSTSPLITDPQLVRKSLNPSEHLPSWGKESTSPTPQSNNQDSLLPSLVENGGGEMFSPDPFAAIDQHNLHPNNSGMEQFGQTTLDDLRPSISPVIPEVSFDQVDATNSDSPIKVDSGFISPKKDMESEEVSQLMGHAQIQRVDQLLQLYNTEDDSPTPDEEKSLEEILAERRGAPDDVIMPAQDDSSDEECGENGVELLDDGEGGDSDSSDDFAKVVVRESLPQESGCLVPPSRTLPVSQEPELVTLSDISPATNAIPELNESMEGSIPAAADPMKENQGVLDAHAPQDQLIQSDQLIDGAVQSDQLIDGVQQQVMKPVNNTEATSNDLGDLISIEAKSSETYSSAQKEVINNSLVDIQGDNMISQDLNLVNTEDSSPLILGLNGESEPSSLPATENGPESISFDLTDTQQGFMLKTPSADEQSLSNFDPNKTPETFNSDMKSTDLTPNLQNLKLSDSSQDGAVVDNESSTDPIVQVQDEATSSSLNGDNSNNTVNAVINPAADDLMSADTAVDALMSADTAVDALMSADTTVDTLMSTDTAVDAEVAETTSSVLSIPSLNIIPSTPIRSLSPIQTEGDSLMNGQEEDNQPIIVQSEKTGVNESAESGVINIVTGDKSEVTSESEPFSASSDQTPSTTVQSVQQQQSADDDISAVQKTESADSAQKTDSKKAAATKDDKKAATTGKSATVTGKSAANKTATAASTTTTKASKIGEIKGKPERPGSGGSGSRNGPGSARTTSASAKPPSRIESKLPGKPSSSAAATKSSTAATTRPTAASSRPTAAGTTRTAASAVPTSKTAAARSTAVTGSTSKTSATSRQTAAAGRTAAATRPTAAATTTRPSAAATTSRPTAAGVTRTTTIPKATAAPARKPAANNDDIDPSAKRKPMSSTTTSSRVGAVAKSATAAATTARTRPTAGAPGSPIKTASAAPASTRAASTKTGVARTATSSGTGSGAARRATPADKTAATTASNSRPASKAKDPVNNRPLTSTEARKPSEAASRVAAARAAAKKNSLPRGIGKPKPTSNTTTSANTTKEKTSAPATPSEEKKNNIAAATPSEEKKNNIAPATPSEETKNDTTDSSATTTVAEEPANNKEGHLEPANVNAEPANNGSPQSITLEEEASSA